MIDCLAALGIDRRFLAWAGTWSMLSLLAFGLVAAIIPNPVFGRQIPPEPFAIAVWLLSAPLMGLIGATYSAPTVAGPVMPRAATAQPAVAVPLTPSVDPVGERRVGRLGSIAGFGAFLAIGCPVCNKVALVLLGTGGALTVWAPLQPVIGGVSLALLAGTLLWRFRLRRLGGVCPV